MNAVQQATNRWHIDTDSHAFTVWAPAGSQTKWRAAYRSNSTEKTDGPRNGFVEANTAHDVLELFAPWRGVRAAFRRALQ